MDPLEDLSRRAGAGRTDFAAQAARSPSRFVGGGRGARRLVLTAVGVLTFVRLMTVAWLMDWAWDWSLQLALPDAVDRWLYPGPRPPRPIDRARWITPADYPQRTLFARPSGTSVIRMQVTIDGSVSDCWTERSSASSVLDDTACELVMKRARYLSARDAEGRAIASEIAIKVRWEAPPIEAVTGTWRFDVDLPAGQPPVCRAISREGSAQPDPDCPARGDHLRKMLDAAQIAAPSRVTQTFHNAFEAGKAAPATSNFRDPHVLLKVRTISLLRNGRMTQCTRVIETASPAMRRLLGPDPPCDNGKRLTVDGRGELTGRLSLEMAVAVPKGRSQ